jgi:hypothetical protein
MDSRIRPIGRRQSLVILRRFLLITNADTEGTRFDRNSIAENKAQS